MIRKKKNNSGFIVTVLLLLIAVVVFVVTRTAKAVTTQTAAKDEGKPTFEIPVSSSSDVDSAIQKLQDSLNSQTKDIQDSILDRFSLSDIPAAIGGVKDVLSKAKDSVLESVQDFAPSSESLGDVLGKTPAIFGVEDALAPATAGLAEPLSAAILPASVPTGEVATAAAVSTGATILAVLAPLVLIAVFLKAIGFFDDYDPHADEQMFHHVNGSVYYIPNTIIDRFNAGDTGAIESFMYARQLEYDAMVAQKKQNQALVEKGKGGTISKKDKQMV